MILLILGFVKAVTFSTRLALKLMLLDDLVAGMAAVLTTSVRIPNQLLVGSSILNCHIDTKSAVMRLLMA